MMRRHASVVSLTCSLVCEYMWTRRLSPFLFTSQTPPSLLSCIAYERNQRDKRVASWLPRKHDTLSAKKKAWSADFCHGYRKQEALFRCSPNHEGSWRPSLRRVLDGPRLQHSMPLSGQPYPRELFPALSELALVASPHLRRNRRTTWTSLSSWKSCSPRESSRVQRRSKVQIVKTLKSTLLMMPAPHLPSFATASSECCSENLLCASS